MHPCLVHYHHSNNNNMQLGYTHSDRAACTAPGLEAHCPLCFSGAAMTPYPATARPWRPAGSFLNSAECSLQDIRYSSKLNLQQEHAVGGANSMCMHKRDVSTGGTSITVSQSHSLPIDGVVELESSEGSCTVLRPSYTATLARLGPGSTNQDSPAALLDSTGQVEAALTGRHPAAQCSTWLVADAALEVAGPPHLSHD